MDDEVLDRPPLKRSSRPGWLSAVAKKSPYSSHISVIDEAQWLSNVVKGVFFGVAFRDWF